MCEQIRPTEATRVIDLMFKEVPVEIEEENVKKIARALAAVHQGRRTGAYALVYFRRLCAISSAESKAAMTSFMWMLACVVCTIVADKMVDDRRTSLGEWARCLELDRATLQHVEHQVVERLMRNSTLHVGGSAITAALAEITAEEKDVNKKQ